MGDDDQSAPVGGEALLQPGHRVDVEVVGGLVEHQEVAVGHQRAGQGHPLRLPAGQRSRVGLGERGHAQVVQDRRRLPRVLGTALHRGEHGAGREDRSLGEGRDAHAPTGADDPGLGHGVAGHDRQQRGLPAPVQPDDAESVTRRERDRELVEQGPSRPAHGHAVEVDEDHRRRLTTRAPSGSGGG